MAHTADCTQAELLEEFWLRAHTALPELPAESPEAWSFGATPAHADQLLELVLAGIKTATSSSLWDLDATGEPVPQVGDLSILLDGRDRPRAVIETVDVVTVPFSAVSAEHAYAEGEDDRTLETWRSGHEAFWRRYAESSRVFAADMPVVCERFRLLWREVEAPA
ncbi:ASCH domain-containing protein [Brevibacterium album]|uniref:ASCH domain-containing protein n=1 Tax=Brevibacterium album TaxID=417948 RepID=UPI00041C69E7|nr:ASCH domain-containing protein [Brevibacterium album]